jgi:hypothetical protein
VDGKIDALLEKDHKRTTKEANQARLHRNYGAMAIDSSDFTIDLNEQLGRGGFATVYAGRY